MIPNDQAPEADPFATFDAAYVLGALSPEDRAEFEQHLRGCPRCARAVQEIAGLPGLLSQVGPDFVVEEPPSTLLPGLAAATRRRRRRARFAFATTGIAAVAACLALVLVLVLPGQAGTAMTPLGEYPVQAEARVSDTPDGARVDMSCSYRGGRVGDYVLVAVGRGGQDQQLATWRVATEDTARISVGTALHRADIAALEIRTPGGDPLLRWNP
ncbi:anti-sigma factor family protein [Amycolatopsis sp. CA-230715]|uniref:anti-sigma factor family protein n=1 Tax=Amycolatopsis sp. CA-230715 TaxID=2745196 RepID=UPI001C01677F|nr:zf-HC2 domain-containing protein [Amycolatopsis sp. CA-230715]QWF84316.1 hypothetical protein HUW46_07766 [Amycolatopsis sp. CA-230715]